MLLLVLLVLGGFGFYVMTPEERTRLVHMALAAMTQVRQRAAAEYRKTDAFDEALRERTALVLVTPALIVLNVVVAVLMLSAPGALDDPEMLIGWGANFGPRTTNGEWWRLVSAMFVHSSVLQLIANLAGLALVGYMLERLVGHVTFAAVYFASGILTSLIELSAHPVSISTGAAGAVFGLYGLLLASLMWGLVRRGTYTISLTTIRRLSPGAFLFLLYQVATHGLAPTAEFGGLVAGFIFGVVSTRGISECTPPARRIVAAGAATAITAVLCAVPLRGLCDVMPEIERLVALELRTATVYESAVNQFRLGGMTGRTLAQMIDRNIVPQLQASRERLKTLTRVPPEHQALVADAEAYLRLRDSSWRLRAAALQKSNISALRKADQLEQASLAALERIRPAVRQSS